MSQENVELTHRSIDAFNRRDLDALLEMLDDDAEVAPGAALIEGNYHGHAGFRRWWESLFEGSDFTSEVVEVRAIGDLTLAVLRIRAHGAASGTLIQQRLWQVSEWRSSGCRPSAAKPRPSKPWGWRSRPGDPTVAAYVALVTRRG